MGNIIKVEDLAKLYKLGEINTGSLSHDITRWWKRLSGKEDPYEKVAETNDHRAKSKSGYIWSLQDINFSVKDGEVFGIVGKNGAGKSTLLKLLSKITKPSRGLIKIDGRIASLLEVGTGFHPDLSGRENVFLNGAILGMRKHEIKNRFDQIVDFSGIEKYIDTPVKRYSSGMFVRLAFSVAAHLEPEILIIDEVLAVGDAEFQQKCLGKMKDVSQKQGRTVLFVSHNVAAVKQLCNTVMLLENGKNKAIGPVAEVLEIYQASETDKENGVRSRVPDEASGYFVEWRLDGQSSQHSHSCYARENVTLVCRFKSLAELRNCEFHIRISYDEASILIHVSSMDFSGRQFSLQPGLYDLSFSLSLPVRKGKYILEMGLLSAGKWIDIWATSTKITVLDTFEGHARDNNNGILNVKTSFSCRETSELVKYY
jgi:lipopolysaccharide transport system ATP-binding protein